MVLSISVCLHTKVRCFSRDCAYFTWSIGLNSKIDELKVTGNDTNKAKVNNLKIFQYVCKGSLYKTISFWPLQTVIVQETVICIQLFMSAVTVQMLWTWTISQRQQRLCAGFAFHAGSTNVFKHTPIFLLKLFLLKTSGTVTGTGPLFDVSAATTLCHDISVQSHTTKSQSTKAN